jgi:hypothetical protein
MAVPETFEDSMRVHDVAFYNWISGLLVDYGDLGGEAKPQFPILRVYSTPQRAYATVVDLLVGLDFVKGADAEEMRKEAKKDFTILPLPIATLERDEPVLDPELPGSPTKEFRTKYFNEATGQYERHPFPSHYRTDYRVTLWCIKKYTEVYMREWIYGQLGNRGAAENELFIPVVHKEPFGEIMHSLKMTGSSDLSDLEGEGARYMRKEYTFSLRTWVFKPSTEGGYPVEVGGTDVYAEVGDDGVLLDTADLSVQSWNLFRVKFPENRFSELWPVEGDATVKASVEFPKDAFAGGVPLTLRIGVAVQADKVPLIESPTLLDDDGLNVFATSFQYTASGRVELEVVQRKFDVDTLSSADSLILPASDLWQKVHYFSVVDEDSYIARIAGIGNQAAQDVLVSAIEVRRVYEQTKVAPDAQTDLGEEIKYEWFSLAREPWLCIIVVSATTGGPNIVTVEDDAAAPAYSAQRVVDSSVNVGAVFLVQPKGDTLALRVPKTTALSAVYIQRFDGPYRGHSI